MISADIINIIVSHPENMMKKLIVDAIVATIFIAQNIPMHMLEVRFFSSAKRSIEAGLRGAMIRKLQQLSISFHNDMPSGKIQSKVMRDVEAVSDFANSIFQTVFSVGVQVLVALFVVLTRNIAVFLMFLVCVPISVFIRKKFANQMKIRNHDFRTEIENTSSAVLDMEELVPVTRAHALENEEIKNLLQR